MENRFPRYRLFVVLIIVWCIPNLAKTQDDADLDLLPEILKEESIAIPEEEQAQAPITGAVPDTSVFSGIDLWLDNTFRVIDWRDRDDLIVSLPGGERPDWANLVRLNSRGNIPLGYALEANFETTLNVLSQQGDDFDASDDLRLDIEEAYISWRGSPTMFLDAGRINIRNGVAKGFNPTDYFRVNSVVTRTTEDVSQLRDNRLGVLSTRFQKVWEGGSLTFVAAPDVGDKEKSWYTDDDIFGLHLNDTNGKTRFMLALTHELFEGFSPEFLYFNESGRHNLGLNLTHALNDRTVLYAEWNVGERRTLVGEALFESGKDAPLHPALMRAFPDKNESYLQQAAIGFTYTSDFDVTTDVEYHFNEAGLDDGDWDAYFEVGEAANGSPAIIGPLLSIRGLARDRLEPTSKHEMMVRSSWTDIVPDLSSTGLVFVDLVDKSYLAQLEVTWDINPRASLAGQIARFDGSNDSNFGSLGQKTTFSVLFNYYF